MITQTELINMRIAANAPVSRAEILGKLIKEDQTSEEYAAALTAERYYKKQHDIKFRDFTTAWIMDRAIDPLTGAEKDVTERFTNPNRSNIRIQHRFLFNHVEQKVSYISGREPSVTIDGAEAYGDGNSGNEQWDYQNALAKSTNAAFNRILLQWERQASLGGKAWLHEYKDRHGKLKQIVVPRTEGLAIYDSAYNREITEFIRYYQIQSTTARGEPINLTRAEWWTDKDVTFFTSDECGKFTQEESPRPHWQTVVTVTGPDGVTRIEKSRQGQNWGKVPFVELANNSDALTDLHVYQDLIDAYDLVASKGTNNLMDFNEFYAVIQGFGGDAASAIVKKLEVNRAVSVGSQGSGNSVNMQQLDLQMAGRIDWLKMLWDAIHYFGCAVDPSKDNVGNAASGTALEFQYSLLDLKANNMITEAKPALAEHFWFVTQEINRANGVNYDTDLVSVQFNKSRITNNAETVSMIAQSAGIIPEKLLLQAHPLVNDADQAYKDLLAEREANSKQQQQIFGTFGQPAPADDPEED